MGATWAEHFAELGGNELWNSARLAAYTANGLGPPGFSFFGCDCPTLPDALGACYQSDPPVYTLPEVDNAPWYDPNDPVSRDFAGLLVTDVAGLMDNPRTRPTFDSISGGSAIGRPHYKGRKFTVTGYLIGRTCCAITYGLKWLGWQALGSQCQGDCGVDDLRFLECCPAEPDPTCTTGLTVDENPADYLRTLSRTALLEGPTVVERLGGGCGRCGAGCEILKIEMVFASGSPYLFAEPILSYAGSLVPTDTIAVGCQTWHKVLAGQHCPDPCPPAAAPCIVDPLFPPAAVPPQVKLTAHPAFCDPVGEACAVGSIPVEDIGSFDATTIVVVHAGATPMRRLRIRLAANPNSATPNWECDACAEMFVSYIPAGGVLQIDGRSRTATITCNATQQDATGSILQSPGGIPFDYFDLECFSYAIQVCADQGVAADNSFEIYTVPRST